MLRPAPAAPRRAPRAWLAPALVALVGLAHRAFVLYWHRAALDALARANDGWYTGQQLPIEMLRDRLFASMLLLQQTPPVPNFLMGLVLKAFAWPTEVTAALVVLQALLSAATAAMVTRILLVLYPRHFATAVLAGVVFVLNTDLVVIEYNSLGQTFYEIVAMLLVVCLAAALLDLARAGRARHTLAAGVLVALLALTRATWSFFALPALGLVLWLARAERPRHAAAFLLPVLVLHGGWAVKNWAVYGILSPATSTWTGWNLVNGVRGAGFADSFRDFVAGRPDLRCFLADIGKGMPEADAGPAERDRRIEERFGLANTRFNTLAMRELLAECERSVRAFAVHAPGQMIVKTARAYRLFWLPPANYGRFFLGLFALENRLDRGLSPARIVGLLLAGELPDHALVRSGKFPKRSFAPTSIFTLRWLEPFTLLANLIGVHLLLPIALLAAALGRGRVERGGARFSPQAAALIVCATCFAYLALFSSAGDYGENMRFRIGVEPLIWLMTIVAARELARAVRADTAPAGTGAPAC